MNEKNDGGERSNDVQCSDAIQPTMQKTPDAPEQDLAPDEADEHQEPESNRTDSGKLIIRNYRKDFRLSPDKKDSSKTTIKTEQTAFTDYTDDMKAPLPFLMAFQDSSGHRYLMDSNDPSTFFKNLNQMHPWLSNKGFLLEFKSGMPITELKYFEFLKMNAKTINRFSCVPEIVQDPQTFYLGNCQDRFEGDACQFTGEFRKLMSTFTTASIKDEYRLAAALLSPFLTRYYDGKRPLFGIVAPSRSAGKTTVAEYASHIVQGFMPLNMEGDGKDDAIVNGIPGLSNRFALFDNIVKPNPQKLTRISRSITDPTIKAWFFLQAHLKAPNNKVYLATFNTEESINEDLLARLVVIRMKDRGLMKEGDGAEVMKKLEELLKAREGVLADIFAGLKLLAERGDESHTQVVHPAVKFEAWSYQISKLLSIFYPEVDCFDFSLSQEDKSFDSEMSNFQGFVDYLYERFSPSLESEKYKANALAKYFAEYMKSQQLSYRYNANWFAQKWSKMVGNSDGYDITYETGHARERFYSIRRKLAA